MKKVDLDFPIDMFSQPTETTCGPTCLHGIYKHLGLATAQSQVIQEMKYIAGGGTLGVHLAMDALKRGFDVAVYTHNLKVFDPSWFQLSQRQVADKLMVQSRSQKDLKTTEASFYYANFLKKGGKILFKDLDANFLYQSLQDNGPLICGLSSTYLYMSKRELDINNEYDDIYGEPQGHFVILNGMSADLQTVSVTDPYEQNPISPARKYQISTSHFINSILIGVITYDANILIIRKKGQS